MHTLHKDLHKLWYYAEFFLEPEMHMTKVVEKIKIHPLVWKILSGSHATYEIM